MIKRSWVDGVASLVIAHYKMPWRRWLWRRTVNRQTARFDEVAKGGAKGRLKREPRLRWSFALPEHLDAMLAVIIHQRHNTVGHFFSVEECLTRAGQAFGQSGDLNVIECLPIPVIDSARWPVFRKTGCEPQSIPFQFQTQECFSQQSIHPTG